MARRNRPQHRPVVPDLRYNSLLISMFISRMMRGGKKSVARSVMYNALQLVEDRAKHEAVEVFEQALRNAAPAVEVKPKRVGGSTYQVPMEVSPERGMSLAMRWILAAARARGGHSMSEKLASELLDAYNNQGTAIKKKDETHRMAEANRAFAHYRW
jgi:small subunit ribosomal protein S7